MRLASLQAPLALVAIVQARGFTLEVTGNQVMVQEAEPYAPQKAANCYWDGTSPFCAGSCNTNDNYIPCRTDPSGDGATCVTGYKKYCCQGSCPSARDIDDSRRNGSPRGDDVNDDYCDPGYIIVCPPGAEADDECHCIKHSNDDNGCNQEHKGAVKGFELGDL